MAEGRVLAVDVGGSHISAAVFDLEAQALGEVGHVPVPAGGSAGHFVGLLVGLCRELRGAGAGPVLGLAAAVPNPFDHERGVSLMEHKFQQLYGFDLRSAIARGLGCEAESILFLNDAAAYLIGEMTHGAAVGVERAVAITLGTGIGSAFGVGGRPVVEGRGVPAGGEIWNLPYLGGIVEDWAGTAALKRIYFEVRTERGGDVSADGVEVREIAAAAATDPVARETFERFGAGLGKLLRFTMAEFGPQCIVIGGGISRSAGLFFPAAERELAGLGIELRVSELSDRAPLIGAAVSWQRRALRG